MKYEILQYLLVQCSWWSAEDSDTADLEVWVPMFYLKSA
jgi:hypothetical protein